MIRISTAGFIELLRKYDNINPLRIAEIISEDITHSYNSGSTYLGRGMRGLTSGTIKEKSRKGYGFPTLPMYRSGQLQKAHYPISSGKNLAKVKLKEGRRKYKGNKGAAPKNSDIINWNKEDRQAFGVSERAKSLTRKYIDSIRG